MHLLIQIYGFKEQIKLFIRPSPQFYFLNMKEHNSSFK